MTTIKYELSDSFKSPEKLKELKRYLDRLYVQQVITSYNITNGLLTLTTIVTNTDTIFNLGTVIGLAIANAISIKVSK